MAKELSIGDMVRAYGVEECSGIFEGVISAINADTVCIGIKNVCWAHKKQCRRLIKKQRRRVWIFKKNLEEGATGMAAYLVPPKDMPNWIEFVETRIK